MIRLIEPLKLIEQLKPIETMKTMKSLMHTLVFCALVAPAGAKDVKLADCPPAVRATIEGNKRDGRIDEVDRYLIEGKTLYVAEVDLPGDRDLKIHVGADGGLLKTREDIALAEIPAAVNRVVTDKLADGKVDDVDKEIAGKTVTYHVEIDRKADADLKLVLAEDGKVLSETEEIDD